MRGLLADDTTARIMKTLLLCVLSCYVFDLAVIIPLHGTPGWIEEIVNDAKS